MCSWPLRLVLFLSTHYVPWQYACLPELTISSLPAISKPCRRVLALLEYQVHQSQGKMQEGRRAAAVQEVDFRALIPQKTGCLVEAARGIPKTAGSPPGRSQLLYDHAPGTLAD